jgi:hypothetical protein
MYLLNWAVTSTIEVDMGYYYGTLKGLKNYWKSSQVFIYDTAIVNLDHFSVLILKLE